ncbi:MAG: PmoA family protein [Clostridia bacterium]|nr:PmoA family protein [Clostridia bacterium]
MNINIKPARPCKNEPFYIECDEFDLNVTCAIDEKGNVFPAQKTDGGVIVIFTSDSTEEVTLSLSDKEYENIISYEEENEKLNILFNGKIFSSYQYLSELKKPFFGPVFTKTGNTFTRPDLHHEEHPHQRSVFVGVGDVNGVDLWNEPEDSGYIEKGKPENFICGSAFFSFDVKNIWVDKDGNKLLNETRKFTLYNQSEECRYVDIDITFNAVYCPVTFGNTKEAGPLGVRVNEKIDVAHGGYMRNSYGACGESECWSKSAQWCLYGGKLNDEDCAIAIFDNEKNERFPTCWHIRNYGLFAANNLFFRGGISIPENEKLTYRYRICFFNNTAEDVSDRFLIYNLNN